MHDFLDLALGFGWVLLGVIVILIAKIILDLATPWSVDAELTEHDNQAVGLAVAGYFMAVIAVFLGATLGPDPGEDGPSLMEQMGVAFAYSLLGVVLLNVGRVLLDKLVLREFVVRKELIEDRNVGTGAVQAGSYLGTGLVVAGAVHGEVGGVVSALVFFAAGQLALILFSVLYQILTPFDLHKEIEQDNEAAGFAFGGTLVALGLVLMRATSMSLEGWGETLGEFGIMCVTGFVVLVLSRFVTDHALLPKSSLSHEVAAQRNVGAAWIEGAVAIGMASVIFLVL